MHRACVPGAWQNITAMDSLLARVFAVEPLDAGHPTACLSGRSASIDAAGVDLTRGIGQHWRGLPPRRPPYRLMALRMTFWSTDTSPSPFALTKPGPDDFLSAMSAT